MREPRPKEAAGLAQGPIARRIRFKPKEMQLNNLWSSHQLMILVGTKNTHRSGPQEQAALVTLYKEVQQKE